MKPYYTVKEDCFEQEFRFFWRNGSKITDETSRCYSMVS